MDVPALDAHMSSSSHSDLQFDAFFIDHRAKWSTVQCRHFGKSLCRHKDEQANSQKQSCCVVKLWSSYVGKEPLRQLSYKLYPPSSRSGISREKDTERDPYEKHSHKLLQSLKDHFDELLEVSFYLSLHVPWSGQVGIPLVPTLSNDIGTQPIQVWPIN